MIRAKMEYLSKPGMETSIKIKGNQILLNNLLVGTIDLNVYTADIVVVESFQLCHAYKRQGIGTAVINLLKREYTTITGCSSPLAVEFWKKVGAEFEYPVEAEHIEGLLEMGEYPPFIIKIERKR